jgi:hypothetical protein
VVRYRGANERGDNTPPDRIPGTPDGTQFWATIVWTALALAILVMAAIYLPVPN